MAIPIIGAGGSTADVGAFAQKGLHVVSKPTDAGALGHYRVGVVSGTMAAALAANSQVFQFKWTDATRFALITRFTMKIITLARFTAATVTDQGFNMHLVRSYALGGGGTTLTQTGDNFALRAAFGTTLVSAINVSTTGALTAATTLDAHPFAIGMGGMAQTTPAATVPHLEGVASQPHIDYAPRIGDGEYPLALAQNEGFVIANRVVWPAAGTAVLAFEVQWSEVTAF